MSVFSPHLVLSKPWWLWVRITNRLKESFCSPFLLGIPHSTFFLSFLSLAPKPLCDTKFMKFKGTLEVTRQNHPFHVRGHWQHLSYRVILPMFWELGWGCYLLSPIRVTVHIRKSSAPYHSCSSGNHSVKMPVWHLLHGGEFICTAA